LRLKVLLNEEDPHVGTVTGVWRTANWHERETYDLMGVIFDGHPDLRRILLPDEWEGHALRKDFPLRGYEPYSLT
jgi:NADH-quinone oxidoreductase subunit C